MIRTALALALLFATGQPAVAATSAGCTTEILEAVGATFHSGPFEMSSQTTLDEGIYTSTIAILPGKGMHVRGELDGKFHDETVVLDGKAWRNTGGGFAELPVAMTGYEAIANPVVFPDNVVSRPACNGIVETPDGAYVAYGFGSDVPGVTIDATLYLDPASRRAVRMQIDMLFGRDERTHAVTTFRYDPSITIVAPLPE